MGDVELAILGGGAAPEGLAANLASLLALPAAVVDSFGEVLEPNLAPVLDDRVETLVKRYCRRHEIEPAALAPSVKACRFLFTNAVTAGVTRAALAKDLDALLGDEGAALASRLLGLFDEALPNLQRAAAYLSVAEHGKVVRGVRWRMDVIRASDHGKRLDVPVATLTLQFQEGANAGQATYQLLPDQVIALRRALDAILD